ncbi:zinc finger protein JAGGED [Jatropha curcas]|uniref:zinc finger protein JAGGED n=1 Tax=Jatropha curcas TaxID=180498 RepID=UPI0009D753AC|nr:zinc finger protein JAGGED [Jatropha curcas]
MRPERNPLDLNNLPDDYTSRDGKQVFDDSSSSGYRKKKSGAKDGKDECGKVYECRFCSLKFCKSQALGGHMNRHRQERETETLNRARQLVFNSDNLAAQGGHLGCLSMAAGSYHPSSNIGDPYRSVYPTGRLFSGSSSSALLPPPPAPPQPPPTHQPYLYTSPSRLPPYPSQYPHHHHHQQQQPINDYYIGHVLNNSSPSQTFPPHNYNNMGSQDSNYTCIGAPVGHGSGFGLGGGSSRGSDQGSGRDGSLSSYAGTQQQRMDPTTSINRFQDGF